MPPQPSDVRSAADFPKYFLPFLLVFSVLCCKWVPYIYKPYEEKIGQRLVTLRDEPLFEYETGIGVDYDGSKREALNRKLYYRGIVDSTIQFLWQSYDRSTFSSRTNRSVEKTEVAIPLAPFPFTINVRGFLFTIHAADTALIAYTILSAEPTDLSDSTSVRAAPRK